jgi:hypothetical protein
VESTCAIAKAKKEIAFSDQASGKSSIAIVRVAHFTHGTIQFHILLLGPQDHQDSQKKERLPYPKSKEDVRTTKALEPRRRCGEDATIRTPQLLSAKEKREGPHDSYGDHECPCLPQCVKFQLVVPSNW